MPIAQGEVLTPPMNPEIKAQWVDNLTNGKFIQGVRRLKKTVSGELKYCCLGVLCEMYAQANPGAGTWVSFSDGLEPGFEWFQTGHNKYGNYTSLPTEVMEWAGLKHSDAYVMDGAKRTSLTSLNDSGVSFARIAQIINEQL